MITGKVREIIKSMGFEFNEFGEYEAKFHDDGTGSLVTIVIREEPDNNSLPRLQFYGYDEHNNSLGSPCTLDQMMESYANHFLPIPKKSNKSYACYYDVTVQVPIDMKEVSQKDYYDAMCHCDDESEVVESIAGEKIKNLFSCTSMNVTEISWSMTEEIE